MNTAKWRLTITESTTLSGHLATNHRTYMSSAEEILTGNEKIYEQKNVSLPIVVRTTHQNLRRLSERYGPLNKLSSRKLLKQVVMTVLADQFQMLDNSPLSEYARCHKYTHEFTLAFHTLNRVQAESFQ